MACFTVGLDLGSAADFSALVVTERVFVLPQYITMGQWHRQPGVYQEHLVEEKHVRQLRRWELGTPYPSIVSDVAAFMRSPQMRAGGLLYVDGTGVGRAVMDMFYQAHDEDDLGAYWPIGVTVTGGREASGWNIPKQDLMAAIQAPLQLGRLKVAQGLPLGESLEKELTNFRLKITQNGREQFDYQRSAGDGHGDLVSALALALYGNNPFGRPDVIENPLTLVGGK
ncbi:hypothetical protein [Arthrobacter castelli]|uniref:hypothetical protein n=1 Tax=Arthrobacter castelli TaxID=271431 RepID=UPI000426A524|nr:hypothetical protein [Arthrobacter castelli]